MIRRRMHRRAGRDRVPEPQRVASRKGSHTHEYNCVLIRLTIACC